jgi:hypothetical protein
MQNERKIVADDYGFFLLSLDTLESFMKEKKIKTRKLLPLLSKNKELLDECIQLGILLPINQITVCSYQLFLSNEIFLDEIRKNWNIVLEEGVFNLKIGLDDKLWFIALSQFNNWNKEKFLTDVDHIGYWVESGPNGNKEYEYIGQRFNIDRGNYFVKVIGLKRKIATNDENKDFGYYFDLSPNNSLISNIIPPVANPNFNLIS